MMEKLTKAFYILTIAMIVFLGGLLISQGLRTPSEEKAQTAVSAIRQVFNSQEGSAL